MNTYYEKLISSFQKFETSLSLKKTKGIIFVVLLLAITSLTILLNIYYPLYADDWAYLMDHTGNHPIKGFSEIIDSQYHHYFTWGGRNIVHIIAQSLLFIGSPWNDLLNSIVYACLILLIYYTANYKKPIKITLLLWSVIFLWLFIPAYGPTILNITTSSNYLWGTVIILAFLYPYCLYSQGKVNKDTALRVILFFIGGVIAGWTNENMALAMIFMIVILLFIIKKRDHKISKWSISGLVGGLTGCLIMLLAPGNFVRYAKEGATISETPQYLQGLYNIIGGFYDNILILFFIYLFIVSLYLFEKKGNSLKKDKQLHLSLIFVVSAMVGMGAMIASPIFPTRAWFGIILFIIIGIAILYANINCTNRIYRFTNIILLITAGLFCSMQYKTYSDDLRQIHNITQERNVYLKEQQQKGNLNIVFDKPIVPKTNFTDISDFSSDSTFWLNQLFSKYHGINSMRVNSNKTDYEQN